METGLTGVQNGELATDIRDQDYWRFRRRIPATSLATKLNKNCGHTFCKQLGIPGSKFRRLKPNIPCCFLPGWEYKSDVYQSREIAPVSAGNNQWQWSVKDVPRAAPEEADAAMEKMTSQMVMALVPPGRQSDTRLSELEGDGSWEFKLTKGRRDPLQKSNRKLSV